MVMMKGETKRVGKERERGEEIFQGISNHSQNGLWLVCHGLAIGGLQGNSLPV